MRDSKNQEKTIVVRKTGTDEYSLVKISNGDVHEFEERGIGDVRDGTMVLRPIELVYLSIIGYRVLIDGNEVGVDELIKEVKSPHALTVYLDMRKRGYFIKPVINGPVDFLVWDKGKSPVNSSPRYMIKIVTEGLGIQVMELLNVLKYSESMGTQLVLALVSSEGVITYYKAFTFRPVKGG
ncbi:endonuclease [Vulcanisaeta distributa]|uniref:tRNA intron endonuclease, catalytic domain protein n=1 Tax=Vulcanisaeta distributa (strain DSM 14429 / JCM 11212 / NBRC 100878 / IC-017) TaxID=572478 RepID=E1QSL0_VULDI|nr:endonuclease [Vulcanisaeta distributa]ADN50803.1 tRNA intron endonuclease, catalytic domain protein [Vulcanisaeta distributa DSM 14429]